ncbi:DUF6048 family protein [uncultured Polaribacter sp.]|uniref:DUF6048 family protein n=1 Tax=uncultured Polaribacter sp. TaxID=174711 RepID=UPI00260EA375|nr:DUF6048 family protein [uncultured Polaribacter sp.]
MYKYFISFYFLLFFVDGFSQEQKKDSIITSELDSIVYKTNYGLRVGLDISKPILGSFNDTYSGLEIVADYRIKKNVYIATEFGYENKTSEEDYTNSTSKGNYLKLGLNYNAYQNWLDMNNEIFVGFRYGLSIFEQTLNNYTPNVNTQYFPANNIIAASSTNLNAHWTEVVVGFRAETLKNFFVSFSGSYKVMLSVKQPDNFQTLYSPGFNRIFSTNSGFGFNYTLTYLIPFSRK